MPDMKHRAWGPGRTMWMLAIISILLAMLAPAAAAEPAPPAPAVRVVLFWAEGCGHCHEVLEDILPVLQQRYGPQLEVRLIEVVSLEDISAFFDVAEAYGFARGRAAVPFLLIGGRALMGVEQIQAELPGQIEALLAAGGSDWPALDAAEGAAAAPPADDICGFAVPCADAPAAPAANPGKGATGLLAAGLGLAAALSIGLMASLRARARRVG